MANKAADWVKDDLNCGSSKETGTNLTFRARENKGTLLASVQMLLKVRLVCYLLKSISKPLPRRHTRKPSNRRNVLLRLEAMVAF